MNSTAQSGHSQPHTSSAGHAHVQSMWQPLSGVGSVSNSDERTPVAPSSCVRKLRQFRNTERFKHAEVAVIDAEL